MTSLLIEHCRAVATMDDAGSELGDAFIAIEDGWIVSIGPEPPAGDFDERLDCSSFLAIPGLINTHHHLYQTLTRGFPESYGQTLFPWLRMLYPIWAGLDESMIYASTRAGLAELALSGCTTCADHLYVFPGSSDKFMDAQVEAAASLGMRFHPTRGSMDLGESQGGLPPDSVTQSLDVILADCERVIDRFHDPGPGSMIRIGLAPCSPFSVTPELMRESARLARRRNVRLHTHIAETMDENAYSREHYQKTPVELLESLEWLGDDVWLAHCVHPTDSDVQRLAANRACVAHCPTSNMLLGSGLAPIRGLLDAGVRVGLGVDGSASNDANDLRQEVKQAVLTARVRDGVASMTVRDALRIATRGGAECLGRDDIGSLEAGKVADIALFDLDSLECAGGQEDPIAAIVLGAPKPDSVMVHGNWVVRSGELATGDERDIATEQRMASKRLLSSARG